MRFCKVFAIIGNPCGIGICTLISYRGFIQMGKFTARHKMSSVSGVGFPRWPFALIMSVGFILLALSFLWAIVRDLAGYQPPAPADPMADQADTTEGGEA